MILDVYKPHDDCDTLSLTDNSDTLSFTNDNDTLYLTDDGDTLSLFTETITGSESFDNTEDEDAYRGVLMVRNSGATARAWAALPEFGNGFSWLVDGRRRRLVWSHDVSRIRHLHIATNICIRQSPRKRPRVSA